MSMNMDFYYFTEQFKIPLMIIGAISFLLLFICIKMRDFTTPKTKTSKEEINNVSDMIQKETGK